MTCLIAFFVGIGSLLWGYDSGIFGTAQAQTYFEEKFHPSSAMLGGIISVYTAGGAVGCLCSGPIGNRFGRRGTIQIGAVIAAIGTAIQTASVNTPQLVVGRLIAGLAIGIIYFAIPQFQSEIAPASHRGFFVGLHAQFIGFGYALSNWIGFGVYFAKGQFTVCTCAVFPKKLSPVVN
jgi:MFS family permease